MLRRLPNQLVAGVLAIVFPAAALASAVVQSARGDVRAGGAAVAQNQRLNAGSTITTGANAQVVMRFDDGQQVVLNQNSQFRIVDFRYDQSKPKEDRAVFDLVRGALRVVTGAVANRNRAAFQLRVPQATIGVRGTDFMVVIVNPAYVSVLAGSVGLTNAAGTTVLGTGAFGAIASSGALAAAVPAGAIPAGATAAFTSMGTAAGVGAAAAGGAAGAAAGAGAATGISGTAAAIGVGAAAAAAAVAAGSSGGDSSSQTPTTTHHP